MAGEGLAPLSSSMITFAYYNGRNLLEGKVTMKDFELPFDLLEECRPIRSPEDLQRDMSTILEANFMPFVNPDLGRCVMFNPGGTFEGLGQFTLALRSRDHPHDVSAYGTFAEGAEGFMVILHPTKRLPKVVEGFLARPEVETTMTLSEMHSETYRAPFVARTCTKSWEETTLAEGIGEDPFLTAITNFAYDMKTCSNACQLKTTLERCGCRDAA